MKTKKVTPTQYIKTDGSVDINIDDYIYRDLIKDKRITNKYDLYEVTAEVCDFMRKELNYDK